MDAGIRESWNSIVVTLSRPQVWQLTHHSFDSWQGKRFFCIPNCPCQFWFPPRLLFNGHWGGQAWSRPFMSIYQGAVKSLAWPERKQAWKHVRNVHDFNIEMWAVIKFFSPPARQGTKGNAHHSDRNISLCPSWLAKDLSAPLYCSAEVQRESVCMCARASVHPLPWMSAWHTQEQL